MLRPDQSSKEVPRQTLTLIAGSWNRTAGWYGLAVLSDLILASLAAWCFALARREES